MAFLLFEATVIPAAFASNDNLVICKDSPLFKKRLITATKKLENRKKLYAEKSQQYITLTHEIERIEAKFKNYEKNNLLCGKEGLPRIVVSGQWGLNAVIIPGLLFIYITGWIGWVGRKYISFASATENAVENEIIINVPAALSIMANGFAWPYQAFNELKLGKLVALDDEITISPR
jgi:photosystem I subunit 3